VSHEAFRVEGPMMRFKKTTALDGIVLIAAPGTLLGVPETNSAGQFTATHILATLTPSAEP